MQISSRPARTALIGWFVSLPLLACESGPKDLAPFSRGPAALASAESGSICGAVVLSQDTVPMPAYVTAVRSAGFVQDASSGITFEYEDVRDASHHIGYVLPDGSAFSCISCAPGYPVSSGYLPGDSFPDGARMLLSAGENNSTSQIGYAILECAPSLAYCDSARVLPVTGFPDGSKLQDRVPKLTPDGGHLVWTRIRTDGYLMVAAPLARGNAGYTLGDARVLNPPAGAIPGEAGSRRVRSSWYEAKSVSYDGRSLAFAATLGDSLNLDWFSLSLDTGDVRRLTRDGDWDEGGQLFPGGRFMTGGSSRGLDITASLGAFPRPALYDHAMIGAMTNAYIPRKIPLVPDRPRSSKLVQHVLDLDCADSDAAMVAVGVEDAGWIGNGGGGTIWARDGVRFVNNEKRADSPTTTRLRVVRLDATPRPLVPPSPLRVPAFAPRLADVPVREGRPLREVYRGPGGGKVTLVGVGDMLAGTFTADYEGYKDAEGTVIDGRTCATIVGPLVAHVEEHLRASGARVGRSDIDVWFADAATRGAARTAIDGEVFERLYE